MNLLDALRGRPREDVAIAEIGDIAARLRAGISAVRMRIAEIDKSAGATRDASAFLWDELDGADGAYRRTVERRISQAEADLGALAASGRRARAALTELEALLAAAEAAYARLAGEAR